MVPWRRRPPTPLSVILFSIERRPDWPPFFVFLDIVWSFVRCSRCKTREAGVGALASTIGCSTKIVAEATFNNLSSELADRSERGAGFDRTTVLDEDLRQHASDGRADFMS